MGPENPNNNNIGPITRRLMDFDRSLFHYNESEWGGNLPSQYSAFNNAGVECEVGEFLYSFIRILKPGNVLETGTHHGIAASYMGSALIDNNYGMLDTIEFNHENSLNAQRRIKLVQVHERVEVHTMPIEQFNPGNKTYQFMLLDTEPQIRFGELVRFFSILSSGGYVFIHDLHRHMHQIPNEQHGFAWPYGVIPCEIRNWVKDGELRPFHFSTPRGLTGFYKVSTEDYKWV